MLLPTHMEDVRGNPENIFYELYMVKSWEGMTQNFLVVT